MADGPGIATRDEGAEAGATRDPAARASATPARVDTIVLAGRRGGEDPLAEAGATDHRAFVDIGGEPMLGRVVRTLRSSPRIGTIAVSIDLPERARQVPFLASLEAAGALDILQGAASPSQSALQAYDFLHSAAEAAAHPVLVTTADHALLDHSTLDHFLDVAASEAAEVAVGLVEEPVIRARFPETERTYLRIGSRRFSGANLFLLQPPGGRRAIEFWRRAETHRKRPWRLVAEFGVGLLLAWALGRLEIDEAFARGSPRLGARARPVLLPFAEAAVDVDKPSDLELARRVVAGTA